MSFPDREFNIEGNPDARFVELVEAVKPDQVTLVPDDIRQIPPIMAGTSRPIGPSSGTSSAVEGRRESGCRCSSMRTAVCPAISRRRLAPIVSRSTPVHMAVPSSRPRGSASWRRWCYRERGDGTSVSASMPDTISPSTTFRRWSRRLPHLAEVSIGHALTSDALTYGMAETIRRYRAACGNPAG